MSWAIAAIKKYVSIFLFAILAVCTAMEGPARAKVGLRNGNFAKVSLVNGNFSIHYTDLVLERGYGFELERVYNHKTSYRGSFGRGWGGDWDTALSVRGDGSVRVVEYGGGGENWFRPPDLTSGELAAVVAMLVKAARAAREVLNDDDAAVYRHKLERDAAFREREWDTRVQRGLVAAREVAVGATFFSRRYGAEVIKRVAGGYERRRPNGVVDSFDVQGRLLQKRNAAGDWVRFEFDAAGHRMAIRDSRGRSVQLRCDVRGQLVGALMSDGRRLEYRYDDRDRLVYSRDQNGNAYDYRYDDRHNMSLVRYSDGSMLQIQYFGLSQDENVKSVRFPNGFFDTYSYYISIDKMIRKIKLDRFNNLNDKISSGDYEYRHGLDRNGREFLEYVREPDDFRGTSKETKYDALGRWTELTDGSGVVTRTFEAGTCTLRYTTPTDVFEMLYDEETERVLRLILVVKKGFWGCSEIWRQDFKEVGGQDGDGGWTVRTEPGGRVSEVRTPDERTIRFQTHCGLLECGHGRVPRWAKTKPGGAL
jgi:YD repeat-containing protein